MAGLIILACPGHRFFNDAEPRPFPWTPGTHPEPAALPRLEPLRVFRAVGHVEIKEDAKHDGRGGCQYEQPLPAGKVEPTVEV